MEDVGSTIEIKGTIKFKKDYTYDELFKLLKKLETIIEDKDYVESANIDIDYGDD